MTRRDLMWRGGGAAIFALACAAGLAKGPDASASMGLLCFALALFGAVLMVQGKRVSAALRIERGRHRRLPQAIHERRCRRSGGPDR
ncbi:hypothetical protein [Sphingomonas sp.]|uniref:hypothetical protein n=1 Tax=Sphingomonas sp. TaxID=28214 RepID=UPI003D6D1D55